MQFFPLFFWFQRKQKWLLVSSHFSPHLLTGCFYVSSFLLGLVKVTLLSVVINCVTPLTNLHFCNKSQKCQLGCGMKSFCCPSMFACLFCGHCNYALHFLCLQGQGTTPVSTLPFFGIAAPAVQVDIRYICFPSNSSESREINCTPISSSVDATLSSGLFESLSR